MSRLLVVATYRKVRVWCLILKLLEIVLGVILIVYVFAVDFIHLVCCSGLEVCWQVTWPKFFSFNSNFKFVFGGLKDDFASVYYGLYWPILCHFFSSSINSTDFSKNTIYLLKNQLPPNYLNCHFFYNNLHYQKVKKVND